MIQDYKTIDCGYTTACWVWQKSRYPNGYGQYTKRDGHRGLAHRAYYELLCGEVPDGMELDHLCRNRACVNPDHLEPVSGSENRRRGAGFSGRNARKTHCKAGHPLAGENLYVDPRGRRQCRTCRREASKLAMGRYSADERRAMYRRYRANAKAKRDASVAAFRLADDQTVSKIGSR